MSYSEIRTDRIVSCNFSYIQCLRSPWAKFMEHKYSEFIIDNKYINRLHIMLIITWKMLDQYIVILYPLCCYTLVRQFNGKLNEKFITVVIYLKSQILSGSPPFTLKPSARASEINHRLLSRKWHFCTRLMNFADGYLPCIHRMNSDQRFSKTNIQFNHHRHTFMKSTHSLYTNVHTVHHYKESLVLFDQWNP